MWKCKMCSCVCIMWKCEYVKIKISNYVKMWMYENKMWLCKLKIIWKCELVNNLI